MKFVYNFKSGIQTNTHILSEFWVSFPILALKTGILECVLLSESLLLSRLNTFFLSTMFIFSLSFLCLGDDPEEFTGFLGVRFKNPNLGILDLRVLFFGNDDIFVTVWRTEMALELCKLLQQEREPGAPFFFIRGQGQRKGAILTFPRMRFARRSHTRNNTESFSAAILSPFDIKCSYVCELKTWWPDLKSNLKCVTNTGGNVQGRLDWNLMKN